MPCPFHRHSSNKSIILASNSDAGDSISLSEESGGIIPLDFEGDKVDVLRHHAQAGSACFLIHLRQVLLVRADIWLPVRVLQHLNFLQSPLDVLLGDACPTTHVCQGVGFSLVFTDEVD